MRAMFSVVSVLAVLIATLLACGGDSEPADAPSEAAQTSTFEPVQGTGENGQLTPSEEVEVLSRTLKSKVPPEIRLFAVVQLAKIGTPDTVEALTLAMADPDDDVAIAAIQGVPLTGNAQTMAQLEKLAEEKSGRVQREAIKRIGEFREQQS